MKILKENLFILILAFLAGGFLGQMITPGPGQANVNCKSWLEEAETDHLAGQNSMVVPKSMLWELDAIYNLQRYQICHQDGE